ncbi:hypothetical protein PAMA_002878 [Pampus argenteus]
MEFSVEEFVAHPTLEQFHTCTKEQLISLATFLEVPLSKQMKKQVMKAELLSVLTKKGLLSDVTLKTAVAGSDGSEAVRLKELEIEMRRLDLKEKEFFGELEVRKMEEETKRQIRLKELELQQNPLFQPPPPSSPSDFDVNKCIRFVPSFNDKDVDKYFTLFERVAESLHWPKQVWPLLLQCVFTGKAQNTYASLPSDLSLNYDRVKEAVLKAYELVPEAYRQRFRRFKKSDEQTYVEFSHEKEVLFDRWCRALDVADFAALRELVLLEELKNCLPNQIVTHISDHKVLKVSEAAVLADEYVLTHRDSFYRPQSSGDRSFSAPRAPVAQKVNGDASAKPGVRESAGVKDSDRVCFFCKKRGHTVNYCFALNKRGKSSKAVNLLKTESSLSQSYSTPTPSVSCSPPEQSLRQLDDVFLPFVMKGAVSLTSEGPKVPVVILRDSAASQSVILSGVLPLSEKSSTESAALVRGFGMQFVGIPLHTIYLDSELVTGPVVVGVSDEFPVGGVSFILGNDLAGGKVLLNPEVTAVPRSECPDELVEKFPGVFSVCAITRAMAGKQRQLQIESSDGEVELSDSFMAEDSLSALQSLPSSHPVSLPPALPALPSPDPVSVPPLSPHSPLEVSGTKLSMSREHLIIEQQRDPTLVSLFAAVGSDDKAGGGSPSYFLKDGVLMRRWVPPRIDSQDDWGIVNQVVVPQRFQPEVLKLAHDNLLAGHLGVNKTYDRVLRCFFWPGLKADVRNHCRTCHVCQLSGKPNQTIPPFPLYPIPVVGEPFEHVIVDCVGPLPRTKSGHQFLLTIMCSNTRFPEAIPLRKITASVVIKALIKFFSLFGLPRVVQTDQGTNFMSKVFAQVVKQLDISHCYSSAYHPESQGALERFHQTLKSMLRSYCLEYGKDWDEGVHLLLFAVREVVQESLGFSPAELVFAHTVRGPLKLLHEKWVGSAEPKNLLDYVCDFRSKLHRVCELAKQSMAVAQGKMKYWFDKDAQSRSFSPGDKVLVLLPVPGSSLQARYSGPYVVREKVGARDYVVATPDRRRRSRLCHINMLKPYLQRGSVLLSPAVLTAVALSGAGLLDASEDVDCDGDVVLSSAVVHGRLKNSELLANLDGCFSHLSPSQSEGVFSLV